MVSVTRARSGAQRRRRGVSLLEALVALPLALLVCALATELFVSQWRVARGTEQRWRTRHTLEEVALVLAAELRALGAGDLEAWSDTSLTAQSVVLAGVVCAVPSPQVIDVVALGSTRPLTAAEFAVPRAGDRVAWAPADTGVTGVALSELDRPGWHAPLAAVQRVGSACAGSPLVGGAAPWRFTLDAASAVGLVPGSIVRVQRRVEWRAYRATDGLHYLGRRDWNGSSWSIVQPAVGPLRAVGGPAVRLSPQRADGSPATPSLRDVAHVAFHVRSTRDATHADSLSGLIALRGGR